VYGPLKNITSVKNFGSDEEVKMAVKKPRLGFSMFAHRLLILVSLQKNTFHKEMKIVRTT
jgi:hypothetical protein